VSRLVSLGSHHRRTHTPRSTQRRHPRRHRPSSPRLCPPLRLPSGLLGYVLGGKGFPRRAPRVPDPCLAQAPTSEPTVSPTPGPTVERGEPTRTPTAYPTADPTAVRQRSRIKSVPDRKQPVTLPPCCARRPQPRLPRRLRRWRRRRSRQRCGRKSPLLLSTPASRSQALLPFLGRLPRLRPLLARQSSPR
jgi:hypothetical protein